MGFGIRVGFLFCLSSVLVGPQRHNKPNTKLPLSWSQLLQLPCCSVAVMDWIP